MRGKELVRDERQSFLFGFSGRFPEMRAGKWEEMREKKLFCSKLIKIVLSPPLGKERQMRLSLEEFGCQG